MDILLPPVFPSLSPSLSAASSLLLSFPASPFIPNLQPLISATYPSPDPNSPSLWGRRHKKHRPSPNPIPFPPPSNDSRIPLETDFHDSYHRIGEVSDFLDDLKKGWPELVEIVTIGNSSEGREIKGIRIGVAPPLDAAGGKKHKKSKGDDDGKGRKKEFVVIGGQHGREWIAPATTLYFAHWLLVNVAEKDAVKHLLEEIDFTIIPVVNPDGYEYSFEKSRLWRKTRFDSGSVLGCKGIDANRGWGYEWSKFDDPSLSLSAAGPCSENYPGKFAFEAPEVRAVANYLETQHVIAFLDIHSYGQLLMFPFSSSCEHFPPDAEDLYEALLGATKSLRSVRGTEFIVGQACELVFRAPGDSIDFAYGSRDIKWSFSMELPDEGTYAFLLPAREIRPVGEETTEALFYLAKFVEKVSSASSARISTREDDSTWLRCGS
ncbi:hypothetical protein BDY24DRAFT_338162 [Mrakia frigida]|uniref:putative metallocarboxypeptidase n=1 Tax=Mrakia frigida TaxID=29902 RepID=UPI003FCC1B04